jgi:hypothetical protein
MRALKPVEILLIVEVILLFLIPLLPTSVLMLSDNIVVRALLLVLLLASSFAGPYALLLTFIVILAIFGLRNQSKVSQIIPPHMETISPVKFAPPLVKIAQPAPEEPSREVYDFTPQGDTGTNDFEPVDISINQKLVQPTQEPDGNGGGIFQ